MTMNSQSYGSMDSNKSTGDIAFKLVNSRDIEDVRKQFVMDGKRPITQSSATFLGTVFVGVPLFLCLLPVSIAYQAGKYLLPSSSGATVANEMHASSEESTSETFPKLDEITPKSERKYDVVYLGCTGFTGRLAAIYAAKTYGVNNEVKWALAGRSEAKLNKLKEELATIAPNAQELDTIIVDTTKPSTMHNLVKDTRVIITSAGPFWKYGSKVVEFCAKYGTDYVDTTGEAGWNKEMIMKWNKVAVQTGSKIISLCGMDSIPWDMTFYKLSQLVKDDKDDDYLVKAQFFDEIKGGISGGTIDTLYDIAIDMSFTEERYDFDPYYQSIDGKKINHKSEDTTSFLLKPSSKGWTVPWFMSVVNFEVIKRSNALLNVTSAGNNDNVSKRESLKYQETWVQPSFKEAFVQWFGSILGATALLNPISGFLMRKFVLPKPGQGPSDKSLSGGYLFLTAQGQTKLGKRVESSLYFPNDPGYADTARMITESGLCLALDADKLPSKGGGFYTPGVGMGDALLERLCDTGCKFASRIV